MLSVVSVWNKLKQSFTKSQGEWDTNLTPWRLKAQIEGHPLQVFFYFSTHLEAKNQEDALRQRGWISHGIDWHLNE